MQIYIAFAEVACGKMVEKRRRMKTEVVKLNSPF
jgi:hypothetical protein